jgi:X-Pro dipeptidyl-peptidase
MRRGTSTARWLGAGLAAAALSLGLMSPSASADQPIDQPIDIVVEDGVTQPVFGYADAVRERLWVEAGFDSDRDGVHDRIAFDIMRPRATVNGLKVPVVMDVSPYWVTYGRGTPGKFTHKQDVDGDGLLDHWPMYYDNYFVPRGYAVILTDMTGTTNSTGCPCHGGPTDVGAGRAVIDWLNGRRTARDADGNVVEAGWHNGKTGMIGWSYDGTMAQGAAATGIEGLTTIVPISAISDWYDYSRSNGIRFNTNYPSWLASFVTSPDRQEHCKAVRDELDQVDGDETGDVNAFWAERNYRPDVGHVQASVFATFGLNDNNVKTDQFSEWWQGLARKDVPRKLWLSQLGHIEPFDFRREAWLPTLNRWFDYWLHGVDNGILDEPMVDIERAPGVWETQTDWPLPEAEDTRLWFRSAGPNEGDGAAGGFGYVQQKGAERTVTFQDDPAQREAAMIADLAQPAPSRAVFVSDALTQDLRISGVPKVELTASVDQPDTNFGAILVDLGTDTRIDWRRSDGARTTEAEDCWGASGEHDDACYPILERRLVTADREVVTKGVRDALNLRSRHVATPLVPGRQYAVDLTLLPEDYTFKAGHRIAVVIVGSYRDYSTVADTNRANITVSVKGSRITLPVVGGQAAARAAGV